MKCWATEDMIFPDFVIYTLPLNFSLERAWIPSPPFFIVSVGNINQNSPLFHYSFWYYPTSYKLLQCSQIYFFVWQEFSLLLNPWQRKDGRLKHCFSNIPFFQNCRQCNDMSHWVMSYISFADNILVWFFLWMGVFFWKKISK